MHDTRRTRLVLGVLLVAALALITLDYRDGVAGSGARAGASAGSVFGSAENVASAVASSVGELLRRRRLRQLAGQDRSLQQQVVQAARPS